MLPPARGALQSSERNRGSRCEAAVPGRLRSASASVDPGMVARDRSRQGTTAVLAGAALALLTSSVAEARTPLPTVEVVPSPRRVRLIDTRGPIQFGWGWSNHYRAPVYQMSFEAQTSFVALSNTTWLHLSLGESAVISAVRPPGEETTPGFLGLDLGLGLSRYAPRGPAFVVGASSGPRWSTDRDELRPNGVGVVGKAELYPFYRTVTELVHDDRNWLRRYLLSGMNVWVSARWDWVGPQQANTYAAGVGLDVGRSIMLPVLMAVDRRR